MIMSDQYTNTLNLEELHLRHWRSRLDELKQELKIVPAMAKSTPPSQYRTEHMSGYQNAKERGERGFYKSHWRLSTKSIRAEMVNDLCPELLLVGTVR